MITKIKFTNYRIFRDLQELEIKPITILFGKNNAGKSAILKLPRLVENSLHCVSNEIIEKRDEKDEDLFSELRDLVYQKANKSIHISVDDAQKRLQLKYSFFIDTSKQVQTRIETWEVNSNGKICQLQWEDNESYKFNQNEVTNITFNGIIPQYTLLEEYISLLKTFSEQQIDYIGPIRLMPDRDMRISTIYPYSNVDGANCYQVLLNDVVKEDSNILKQVSKWYEDNFSGWKIKIDTSRAPVYNINLEKNSLRTNLRDTGLGIIQSMPIVIRACRPCKMPTLIELEEPETHLHPAAHANLAELIAQSTKKDPNKRYLIETHSQNFILRLRRMIAEGKLDVNSVQLYYVEFDAKENGSKLSPITIHKDGSVNWREWPKGVFEESLDEIIAINSIRN